MAASLQACGVVFPFAMPTSICRSIVTICSGLYLLTGMTRFSSKWILSHSTWYKFCRSRHNVSGTCGNSSQSFILPTFANHVLVRQELGEEDACGFAGLKVSGWSRSLFARQLE